MAFRIRKGDLLIEVDSPEEFAAAMAAIESPLPTVKDAAEVPELPSPGAPSPTVEAGHDYSSPTVQKLAFESAEAAFGQYLRDLRRSAPDQVLLGLKFLAERGESGANADELRAAMKVDPKYRMNGFTAVLTRRPPAYGIDPADVLTVKSPGIVAGQRVYSYRLARRLRDFLAQNPDQLPEI